MIGLSAFTLPFDFREPPIDWFIVCLILVNMLSLVFYITAYIEFKVKPPLSKFGIRGVLDYLREFATGRNDFIIFTLFADIAVVSVYALYFLAILLHFTIFE